MSEKIRKITVCDMCGKEGVKSSEGAFSMAHGHIEYHHAGKGIDGAWGGYSRDYDLCQHCLTAFDKFVESRKSK